ncbi:MAG: DJ-1/PfpI family protein [Acidimicrobiia bacterium]|nr:DJ-1/PfpI family protein [Acidimicrobiia bacterium]
MRIGILLFDDVDLLDVGGPYEVFLTASRLVERDGGERPFDVITIGSGAVTAYGGLGLTPSHAVGDVDRLDLLVVPGAIAIDRVVSDPAVVAAAELLTGRSEVTASVCTGAFLLGRLGLLEGIGWTTHFEDVADLAGATGSDRGVVAPWVDEGDVVTAGGLSSGIAMALHLVQRFQGRELALRTARQLQYAWSPSGGEYAVVVLVWAGPEGREALHAYERSIVPLVEAHGGSFEAIVEPTRVTGWEDAHPDELHVLVFPDEEAFAGYLADPRREGLATGRERAVARAVVFEGVRTTDFG